MTTRLLLACFSTAAAFQAYRQHVSGSGRLLANGLDDMSHERVAVVIDCGSLESWPGRPMDLLMLELAQWGSGLVRRAYGQFAEGSWQQSLQDHAFTPVHHFSSSSAQTSLVIDCMDMLFDRDIDTFVLVSNSGSLSRLATRIRETDRKVIGYGDRSAERELVVSCHRFVYRDNLGLDIGEVCDIIDEPQKVNTKNRKPPSRKCVPGPELAANQLLMEMLSKAVRDNAADDDYALLSTVGREIHRFLPDFDPRDFGYNKLGDLMRATNLFHFEALDSDRRTLQVKVKRNSKDNNNNRGSKPSSSPSTEEEPRRALV